MKGPSRICSICNCSWNQHTNCKTEIRITRQLAFTEIQSNRNKIAEFENLYAELKRELGLIQDLCASLAYVVDTFSSVSHTSM